MTEYAPQRPLFGRIVINVVVPLILLSVAAYAAWWLMQSPPESRRRARQRSARLVEVQTVEKVNVRAVVVAQGTVVPAREIELRPRVMGLVDKVGDEFGPGGIVHEGDLLVQLDRSDYELVVERRKSQVVKASNALNVEMGLQEIARREYEMLGEEVTEEDAPFVLRKFQLENAQSEVAAANADLEQAQLNLERTTITAPFNALVLNRMVNVGSQISTSTTLAHLVDIDEFWVEVLVPLQKLEWLQIPRRSGDPASPATIRDTNSWGLDDSRSGEVVRLVGDVETQGRMARIIVSVKDPLGIDNTELPAVLLGSYVRVDLEGHPVNDVVGVPRTAVHDTNTVWIMNAEDVLEVRTVEIAYGTDGTVYVSNGIAHGERVITTSLGAAVPGMPLRTGDEVPTPADEGAADGGRE